jgi:hypothetical protein
MGGMAGKSIGVAGLYHFNPQGNYSPFVKIVGTPIKKPRFSQGL